jgi:phosphomannomutase
LAEPLESFEFRMKIKCEDFKAYGNKIIQDLEEYAKTKEGWSIIPNNFEGIRIAVNKEFGDGWFLLRLSLHDPVMPLNIESDSNGGSKVILSSLSKLFNKYEKLDCSAISIFLD